VAPAEAIVTEPLFNSLLLAVVGAVLTFLVTRYFANRRLIESEHDKAVLSNALRDDRITALQTQLAVISAAVVPISTAFQSILIKELTHYHTPELDELMKRIGPPCTLSDIETKRLEVLLRERERDPDVKIPESERDAATMLPLVMKRATAEAAAALDEPNIILSGTMVQFVSLPPHSEGEPPPDPKRPRLVQHH
jgi:hypothetical protein